MTATRGWFPFVPNIAFVLIATFVVAHVLFAPVRKIVAQASVAVVFWASCIAIWSRLEATLAESTAAFCAAKVVAGVLVSILVS